MRFPKINVDKQPCRASGNNSSRHTRRGPFYRVYGNLLFNLTTLALVAGHAWYRTIVYPRGLPRESFFVQLGLFSVGFIAPRGHDFVQRKGPTSNADAGPACGIRLANRTPPSRDQREGCGGPGFLWYQIYLGTCLCQDVSSRAAVSGLCAVCN